MARLLLLPIVLGFFIIGHGCDELRMAGLSQAVPTVVELADLENGERIDNAHIKIGEHIRLYDHTVYRYTRGKNEPIGSHNRVTECYVPVISTEHPFLKRASMLLEMYGSFDKLPKETEPPELRNIAVLISTNRFDTVGAIPNNWETEAICQGLVINRIRQLNKAQIKLVRDSFPDVQMERVLILEEGRLPLSKPQALMKIVTGLLFWVGTAAVACFMWKRKSEPSWS